MSKTVSDLMRGRLQNNAVKFGPGTRKTIPDIPDDGVPAPKKKRWARNTVFDDHGDRSAG